MGTGIHLFIEVDYSTEGAPFTESGNVRAFAEGELFVWNDYKVFDALANGRSRDLGDPSSPLALITPRGIPPQLSEAVFRRFYVRIADSSDAAADCTLWIPSVKVSSADAERYVAEKLSQRLDPRECPSWARSHPWISNPDWHSATWLTLQEFNASLAYFGIETEKLRPEIQLIPVIMKRFEDTVGKNRTRVVVWFDN